MPIALDNQQSKKPHRADLLEYTVKLQDGHVVSTFAVYADDGTFISLVNAVSPLFLPDGTPRFSAQLYSQTKSTLLSLAIADGHLSGTVI